MKLVYHHHSLNNFCLGFGVYGRRVGTFSQIIRDFHGASSGALLFIGPIHFGVVW